MRLADGSQSFTARYVPVLNAFVEIALKGGY